MSKAKYYHIKKCEKQKNWLIETNKISIPDEYRDVSEYLSAVSQNQLR